MSTSTHPYLSWERELNENTNELIRQYFPKGRELTAVAREESFSTKTPLTVALGS